MTLEVRITPRETEEERCPYCHDALLDVGEAAHRIECPACHTWHHLACIMELGRCTIRGCERPLEVSEERAAGAARSRFHQEVQARIRERVRGFVRQHCKKPAGPAELVPALQMAVLQARRAEERGDWATAAEWWGEAASIETIAKPGQLSEARDRVDPDEARARADMLLVWAKWRAARRLLGSFLLLLLALTIAGLILIALTRLR
jgi:hypothetical protein